ncbi:Spo0E family sporulation regulatory protein-aspartic acid phosphatase [Paenibacillaceae bacterium WGS1546]|uniref:Spo0E family sporulation regulatory protein-aspartic acid phosphatase n=1 Tax=Cohnella sp. WGS1546 TaxID=3366810 RepID=UPI00372D7CF6
MASKSVRLSEIKRQIEKLRGEMILKFVQVGSDLNHPHVLALSQLLDEQLNRYDRCLRHAGGVSEARDQASSYAYRKRRMSSRSAT